ncbi:MAG: 16S rRNA (guanine(527)-N(7))-methyltransferase RsmG [Candidatus Dormibacteraeota bacterium]|nr:16S rRNA (guanine(527)-N(7))-methyltransferase RsmG [Candidatus Dormibacteraeota bacterium]
MDSKLTAYTRLLAGWPGLASRPDLALVEDSLVLLPHLDCVRSLIDVGSGGGMPGLPLALARPDLDVTLLEAEHNKTAFLIHCVARLDLMNVRVISERAETAAHTSLRETFDVATCRALAALPVLAELCLPFVRVGGRLLALKSRPEPDGGAVGLLGGGPVTVLPAPSAARSAGVILAVSKVGPTPDEFPRRPGLPNRRPLHA